MISYVITFLMFLEITCALLLIVVILMQRSKSGGGLGAIGGGATEEVLGSNAGNILTRTTVILSVFFLINTLGLAVLQGNALRGGNVSVVDSVEDTQGQIAQPENAESKNAGNNSEKPDASGANTDAPAPKEGS